MTANSRRSTVRGRSPLAAGLLLVLVAASCSGDRDPGAQSGWDGVPRWSLSSRPALELGGVAVADAELFGNLRGADRTVDGSIAVADASTDDIRLFSPSGEHTATLGRSGRGPGEFREIWDVFTGPGDTIWGFDQPTWKQVAFHGGTHRREFGTYGAWPIGWLGSSLVARVIPADEIRAPREEALQRSPLHFVAYPADGTRADTLASGLEVEAFLDSDRNWQQPLLPHRYHVDTGSDFVATADNARPDLILIDGTGDTVGVIPVPELRGGRLQELASARRKSRLARVEPENMARAAAILDAMPIPDRFTDISTLMVDDVDRIWVRPLFMPEDSTPDWHVYDRAGRPMARIAVPARLRLQSIGLDQIVAFDRGEFDVPLVVVYDIVR